MAETLALPAEDRERSPRTGWTRAHWEALADHLLGGVRPYASPGCALYSLPGRPSASGSRSDSLEGYARTFLLAALRIAGAGGALPDLIDRYRAGLIAGTAGRSGSSDANSERWLDMRRIGQVRVEAALIAAGLFETRPWIWDTLTGAERESAIRWFSRVHGLKPEENNWLLFPVLINSFLKSVGAPHEQREIDEYLDRIDAMYRRDGWYTDGQGSKFDHYGGWSIHLYNMLWCRMDGDANDPSRAAEYRLRLRRFLEDAQYLFGGNGAPLFQGRSLIYRCAATAAAVAGALCQATPLAAGETRRLASGALRYFVDHGAIRDGLLTMGWHDEFVPMAQDYSGPASPYWASKGFLGLLLPKEDPFWTATEEPLPVERGDFVRTMAAPNWLVGGTQSDGIVRVSNHGSDHFPFFAGGADPAYRKLSYSTHAGPELGGRGDDADTDSHVALLDEDGVPSTRSRIHPIATADRFAASYYFPKERPAKRPGPSMWNDRIETAVVLRGRMEVRVHSVISARGWRVREGGWAVASDERLETADGAGWALARTKDGLTSFIAGVHGYETVGVQTGDGDNAFGRFSATPFLVSDRDNRTERTLVSIAVLTKEPLDPEAVLAELERIDVTGRLVRTDWANGEAFAVQLVSPDAVSIELAGQHIQGHVRYARVSPDGTRFVLRDT